MEVVGGNISVTSAKAVVVQDSTVRIKAAENQPLEVSASSGNTRGNSEVVPKEQLEKIISGMNEFLKASPNTHLKFEFHDELNQYYVTIVDETTNEVVKEIPSKKMLDMFAAMTEFMGLLVDKKI